MWLNTQLYTYNLSIFSMSFFFSLSIKNTVFHSENDIQFISKLHTEVGKIEFVFARQNVLNLIIELSRVKHMFLNEIDSHFQIDGMGTHLCESEKRERERKRNILPFVICHRSSNSCQFPYGVSRYRI